MFTGRNTLLREVIRFFLDYEIRKDSSITEDAQRQKIRTKNQTFHHDSTQLSVSTLMEPPVFGLMDPPKRPFLPPSEGAIIDLFLGYLQASFSAGFAC